MAATAVALVAFAPTNAIADDKHEPTARAQLLARPGHGAAVVQALGDRLPAAAETNRMSPEKLRHILETDPTAWIGGDGQMFYVEPTETLAAGESTVIAAATYPESQTFALHSLPGSSRKIFLDFDGATVSGTWWNSNKGMAARFYTGFTLDADPRTFTSAENAYIQQVWRIVSEKFAAFDVDVTTQDPGESGYNRSGSADQTYGDHVVITEETAPVTAACGGSCSGVALLGTFDDTWRTDSYLEPAWVFSSKTSDSPVLTAHTAAHEVGHTFGLNHDGDASRAYSSGHGNWFPLMGSSARAVGQFSKGEYAGANNKEDDLAVIAAGGAPLRADDHGDTLGAARPVATGSATEGVISTRTDRDVFAVDHACTTNLTASATGVGAGASLDLSVTVVSSSGATLATNNPVSGQNTAVWPAVPTGMNASVTMPAGNATYYVRVDGVGMGDPVNTGYSDYGSLGRYQLAISGCDGSMPPTTWSTTTATSSYVRRPSAPRIGLATSGRRGRPINATARWAAPVSTGGAAVTYYRVRALQLSSSGRVVRTVSSRLLASSSRSTTMRLPRGRYRFKVIAHNRVGASPISAASRIVTAR